MGFLKRYWWILILLAAVLVWWLYRQTPAAPSSTRAQTSLEVEVDGGFAYVVTPAENRLEFGFLRDTNVTGCTVDQLGTDLMVVGGTIVEPATPPPSRIFDLEGAVVTFPDLETANLPLTATRGPRPPSPHHPVNPNDPAQWEDLQWVVRIGEDFPASSLNPAWRSMVDGRFVLRGGTLKGMHPTDVVVNTAVFEFRKGATPAFRQALTDQTHYSVMVPRDRVELLLAGAKSGITRIVVTPASTGTPVQLKLMGRHAKGTPVKLPPGSPITDFCAFYQLLQPVPDPADWLIPHYLGPYGTPGPGAGDPGPFCTPNWFP